MAESALGSFATSFSDGFMGGKKSQRDKELNEKLGKLIDAKTGEIPKPKPAEPETATSVTDEAKGYETGEEEYMDGGMAGGYMEGGMMGEEMHEMMEGTYSAPTGSSKMYDPYRDPFPHTCKNDFAKVRGA